MRADMTVGPLRINVERGYKARVLEAGDGQVLIQLALEDGPWPGHRRVGEPLGVEDIGFAGAAALVVPAAKGVVRVVKAAKEAGVLQDGGGARGVVRKLREKFRARPGRVIKLRGPFNVAGCCAKCGGGGR
ncbi:MAG: hypothetical protein IPI35_35465 [Deltaproteobacteria bacterium]|nr:hypothetical protein [Deltaproteobacteria bacterium]